MSNFSTVLQSDIVKGETLDKIINEYICHEVEIGINELLKHELTVFLDYEKHDPIGYNTGNNRNGKYTRQLKTKYGEVQIEIPRDRNGEFHQRTLRPYTRQEDSLETTIIQLYQKGITTNEIADLVEKMYGHHYSPATISNITQLVEGSVNEFHLREIQSRYAVIYCDATFLNVRRDSVAKEALHVLIGINLDGQKEILDYRLFPGESCDNYREMFIDLKHRGLSDVLLFVSDGLVGLPNVISEMFPHCDHQSCWVHIDRNIMRLVRATERSSIMNQVKQIYQADTLEEATAILTSTIQDLQTRYPKVSKLLSNNPSLLTFYRYPKQIQHSIYTTNLIEGFNKHLKRSTNRKEQFPNEDSLDRFVGVRCIDYNQKFTNRIHKGFGQVTSELEAMFN